MFTPLPPAPLLPLLHPLALPSSPVETTSCASPSVTFLLFRVRLLKSREAQPTLSLFPCSTRSGGKLGFNSWLCPVALKGANDEAVFCLPLLAAWKMLSGLHFLSLLLSGSGFRGLRSHCRVSGEKELHSGFQGPVSQDWRHFLLCLLVLLSVSPNLDGSA